MPTGVYERKETIKRPCWANNHVCHISLLNGEKALCDEDRFKEVAAHNWYLTEKGYVKTNIKGKSIKLHRFLYPDIKDELDHINRNKLDNRSCNLRISNRSFNVHNRNVLGSVKYKGVRKQNRKFRAVIMCNYKTFHLGYHSTPELAARAYDKKAIELFGEHASLNFPAVRQ